MASSNASAIATLVLRVLTLILLLASSAILVTDKVTIKSDNLGEISAVKFSDIRAYKYVLATIVLGIAYTILQVPFAVFFLVTGKRMIRNGCLPQFDFYGDKIIAFILATGVGVGFGVTTEFKRFQNEFVDTFESLLGGPTDASKKLTKFFNMANFSFGFLFLGFLCMAILSVLSSLALTKRSGGGFFR